MASCKTLSHLQASRPALALALVALAGTACVGEPAPDELLRLPRIQVAQAASVGIGSSTQLTSAALAAGELGTGSYQVPGYEGRILLRDGQWEDAATRAFAQIADGFHALGDFDGDGEVEAATVLTLGTGGMNVRTYLLGVGGGQGRTSQEAALLLGERVQVTGLRSISDRLELELRTFGPGDDPCCPTRRVVRSYQIRGGTWVGR